jgi:diguanylate cyclase (GGDEF)-like protein/PAS domain S-box-containing protein
VGADGDLKKINAAFEKNLGWNLEQIRGRSIVDFVHPDDISVTLAEIERLGSGLPRASFQNRFRTSDGSYKDLNWTIHSSGGNGLLYAVARDVTEQAEANQMFRISVEASPIAMLMVDQSGVILVANTEAERLFRFPPGKLKGQQIESLIPSSLRSFHGGLRKAYLDNPQARPMGSGRDLVAVNRQGGEFPVEIGLNAIRAGNEVLVLAAIVDLTERKKAERKVLLQSAQLEEANKKLAELVGTDELTGAKNRRAFLEELERHLGLAIRHGHSLSLALLDVDDFKSYNDTYGHQAGDKVLKQVVQDMQGVLRKSDLLARIGGEEFAMILPETTKQGSVVSAERCRRAIARRAWPKRSITVSIGVATYEFSGTEKGKLADRADSLIAAADQALYRAKKEGKNRVVHGDELYTGPDL